MHIYIIVIYTYTCIYIYIRHTHVLPLNLFHLYLPMISPIRQIPPVNSFVQAQGRTRISAGHDTNVL